MLSIKALLAKILHCLRPIKQTTPTAGTNVNLGTNGGNNYVYRMGKLVIVSLNFQITGNISSGATLISGLPKAATQVSAAASRNGQTNSASIRIQSGATAITADGAISSATGWYDASFSYIAG